MAPILREVNAEINWERKEVLLNTRIVSIHKFAFYGQFEKLKVFVFLQLERRFNVNSFLFL